MPEMVPAPATSSSVLILTRHDVRQFLTMRECIDAVEEAFRLFGDGAVPPPGVLGIHLPAGSFHIKAGAMPFNGRWFFVAKTNANYPQNRSRYSLPTIQGAVLLFDAERGTPLAVMDSIEITALRTAAATAVAAKYLARKNSAVATIIGCGVQGKVHAAALLEVLPLTSIFAYDIDSARAAEFVAELRKPGLTVNAVPAFAEAAKQSDVIVTCTTAKKAFLMPEHVRPGTFVAAVGADNEEKRELDLRLLAANRVVPDVVSQAATIGELHHAVQGQSLELASIKDDLGKVVAGAAPGRASEDEIIIFDSTGMALQDVAAACAVYRKARATPGLTEVTLNG